MEALGARTDPRLSTKFNSMLTKSLQLYLADIRKTPVLTRDECYQLAVKVRSGDADARTQIILAHQPLVLSIAKRHAHFGVPLGDLIAEGNRGLIKAVDRFDPHQGAKLSTYAIWGIRQTIRTALSELGRTIRMPSSALSKAAAIKRTEQALTESQGRVPTVQELSRTTGIPVRKIVNLTQMTKRPISLSEPARTVGDDGATVEDLIPDPRAVIPSTAANVSDNVRITRDLLNALEPRDRRIIELRYGFDGNEPRTLEQIAVEFRITRERIRQLQERAIEKMQAAWRRKGQRKLACQV
jgi:RNA polymerase primary sigma factor